MTLPELEQYFSSVELPESIQLDKFTYVEDLKRLIDSNIAALKAHPGNKSYMPYYNQLIKIKEYLETST